MDKLFSWKKINFLLNFFAFLVGNANYSHTHCLSVHHKMSEGLSSDELAGCNPYRSFIKSLS